MAIREIVKYGHKALKTKCDEVKEINEEIINLVNDMRDTLKDSYGIGLAAPQIGVLKRVVIINLGEDESTELVLINPKIVKKEGKELSVEGCLSLPGYEGELMRPKKVVVEALNLKGELKTYEGVELLGKAFCHELDHLDGIMYVDRTKKVFKLEEE